MPAKICPSCSALAPAGSRFCPSCGETVIDEVDPTSTPTQTAALDREAPAAAPPSTSSGPSDHGRFLPGQVLAERYRIIGLLGRGGMGEVYRADDLKLGQSVALKFLPEAFSKNVARQRRFFNEVRTARQVTHPNVCRVHDLGEVDGHHYLSMEYVDGEDLGTLLRRIGRVPKDKAVQIARQLCAGLAAAHDEGILHRDLKPANIMLDGRGRARITDFGLAGLAESIEGGEILAGTPAYQAPEQLAGKEVSKASDIYALGLVLYELFTGKRAFEASSAAELREMQHSATPASLTSHVEGLDDTIERIVLRCLDPDPRKRPDSPLAVSAALPGGDPLAAALAAGETPSPEMVANAEVKGALRLPIALSLLLAVVIGLSLNVTYRSRSSTLGRLGLPKSPAQLRFTAQLILDEIGHEAAVGDWASGLYSSSYYGWVRRTDDSVTRWDDLESTRPHPVYYWYRQGPKWLKGTGDWRQVFENAPPHDTPGMAALRLDATGRLMRLMIVPPAVRDSTESSSIDWEPLLRHAALDSDALKPVDPRANPILPCDQRIAWEGDYGDESDPLLHIEACGAGGAPLYFEVFAPWSRGYDGLLASAEPAEAVENAPPAAVRVVIYSIFALFGLVIVGAVLLARRNVRLGRGDRRGAFRIAVALFAVALIRGLMAANHVAGFEEMEVLMQVLARAVYTTILAWVFYLAAEPFVRRVWPDSIISWRRLLEGRLRDPLLGRDMLIGGAMAQIVEFARLALERVKMPPDIPGAGGLGELASTANFFNSILGSVMSALMAGLGLLTLVVLVRIALRSNRATWLVLTGLMVTLLTLAEAPWGSSMRTLAGALLLTVTWGALLLTVIRFGLLAIVFSGLFYVTFLVLDPSSWHFAYVLLYLLLCNLAPSIYAFWISLGDTRLIKAEMLDG